MANNNNNAEDTWTFTLPCPPTVHRRPLQWTHTQPRTRTTATVSNNDNDDESQPLFLDDDDDKNHGWTWTSPYGRLQSDILLRATYRPAWQTMPAFTQQQQQNSWQRYFCCCRHTKPLSLTTTWRTTDIVRVRTLADLHIPGVGPCRAWRIALCARHNVKNDGDAENEYYYNDSDDDNFNVPLRWRAAWNEHVVRHHQQQQQQQQSEDKHPTQSNTHWTFTPDQHHFVTNTTNSTPNYIDHDNDGNDDDDDDDEEEEGPILWMAWPQRHAFAQVDPPLLWRVTWPPHSTQSLALETLTVLEGTYHPWQTSNDYNNHTPATHIFINGYQSWSFCGTLRRGQAQPQPALPKAFSFAFNDGGQSPPNSTTTTTTKYTYQSDFFTCLTTTTASQTHLRRTDEALPDQQRGALVVGWLSQRHQFGIVQVNAHLNRLAMHASADGQVIWARNEAAAECVLTDWAYAQMVSPHSYDQEPLVHYFHAVATYNAARPLQNGNLLVGWCSWYHYYEKISEQVLSNNFVKLARLQHKVPMNVSVVDDGYMTAWGDWDSLKPQAFPSASLLRVARDIRRNHMRPGLWLAPFTADKHAQLAQRHPDWIIRNDRGVPANSSNCGKFFYGLDATNPGVREHVATAIRRAVVDWEFTVLKIDFLYAACLRGNGRYDLTKSRAQAMHMALETIRQAAGPDTFLIGCGCPIASAIGYVDGMRVSADTGPTWYPAFPFPWWDHGTLPCLRSMIRNSLTRAPMGHRWWHNDPDCLLLGESTRLTQVEVASAASIVAMTCGMMLLSDDLTRVSLERMRVLSKIFPMAGATAVVLDLHRDGLPRLLRLWATDRYSAEMETAMETHLASMQQNDSMFNLEHVSATFYGRQASFSLDHDLPPPNERKRSCIHVCEGLGTWTIVSLSNWSDQSTILQVPPAALLPPPLTVFDDAQEDSFWRTTSPQQQSDEGRHGFHVWSFWSSRYTWLPPRSLSDDNASDNDSYDTTHLRRRLEAHETEIFHVKAVTPDLPQYIGSDLHFSCGKEVQYFTVRREKPHVINLQLQTSLHRVGHVWVYLPVTRTDHVRVVQANVGEDSGSGSTWTVVGNTPRVHSNGSTQLVGRIIRIRVVVRADGSDQDGWLQIHF